MIDFKKSSVFKLEPIEIDDVKEYFHKFLMDGEFIFAGLLSIREQVFYE